MGGRELSDKQRKVLADNAIKPGEVKNPRGINGWSKLREALGQKAAEEGMGVYEVMLAIAKDKDHQDAVAAGRLVLGPSLGSRVEHDVAPEAADTIAELVAKAKEGKT